MYQNTVFKYVFHSYFAYLEFESDVETEVFTILNIVAIGGIRFTQNGEVGHYPIVAILFKEALYFPIAEQVGV